MTDAPAPDSASIPEPIVSEMLLRLRSRVSQRNVAETFDVPLGLVSALAKKHGVPPVF